MIKIITTAILAGTMSAASLSAIANAEPSEGKFYGKCHGGTHYSSTFKKCVR